MVMGELETKIAEIELLMKKKEACEISKEKTKTGFRNDEEKKEEEYDSQEIGKKESLSDNV